MDFYAQKVKLRIQITLAGYIGSQFVRFDGSELEERSS